MTKPFKTYECYYRYNGYEYLFYIKAEDREKAGSRLEAIRQSGQVDGEVVKVIEWDDVDPQVTECIRVLSKSENNP